MKPVMNRCFQAALANLAVSPRTFLRQLLFPTRISSQDEMEANALLKWLGPTVKAPSPGKTALILSLLTLPYCLKMESLLARALQRAGYHVVVLTNLASRAMVEAYHARAGGLTVRIIDAYMQPASAIRSRQAVRRLFAAQQCLLPRVKDFQYRGAPSGLHSIATLSASIKSGSNILSEGNQRCLHRLMAKSIALSDAAHAVLDEVAPDVVLGIEKGYVGTAEIFYAALNRGVDYVQWVSCHEPDSIMLKRYWWRNYREHPFSISEVAWSHILTIPWQESFSDKVLAQFERGYKEGAWFRYKSLATDQRQVEKRALQGQLSLDPSKKTAIIYSHILNDANLFYGQDLFDGGYEEWLVETVRAAAGNPAVNWVLKLHPSNVYRNAKLGYTGEYGEILALKQAFGKVPDFLRVVYPEEKVSPFSFFQITDYGVTVRGTVGLELPCFGIPTLTAGTGRYAGKGFTVDSSSREEYLAKIRAIHEIPPLTTEQIQKGQRYAYFVFRARPARYGDMFSDVYNFPLNHPRYRDIALGGKPLDKLLDHPQMQKIVDFLCSDDEDFLDFSVA